MMTALDYSACDIITDVTLLTSQCEYECACPDPTRCDVTYSESKFSYEQQMVDVCHLDIFEVY